MNKPSTKTAKEGGDNLTSAQNEGVARKGHEEHVYDFGNSPVLLTHPAINSGETVQGVFTGYWSTVRTRHTSFAITEVNARLVVPCLDLQAPGKHKPMRTQPGSIYLSITSFDVPEYLAEVFPHSNTGTFDLRHRFYSAVFGLRMVFPFAYAKGDYLNLAPSSLLLRTTGYVAKDGSLIASGFGTIVDGLLRGLMFCCSHGTTKPTSPIKPKCNDRLDKDGVTFVCGRDKDHEGEHLSTGTGMTWQ